MSEYIPRLQEAITSSIHDLSRESMLQQLDGKWSIAQVLEHLYLTYTATVKGCERALAAENTIVILPTMKQRLGIFVVITLGYFPRGIRAPEQVCPKGIPIEQVIADVIQRVALMDDALSRCESRYGKGRKLFNHPILGALTGPQWRKFHWVHGRHHVQQIIDLRKKIAEKNLAVAGA